MNPDPASVVPDADVLAADLFDNGPARTAIDILFEHTWMTLVTSEPLLDDAAAIIAALGDDSLAADWRDRIESETTIVEHPTGDHSALAAALAGEAAHLLTLDESLTSAATGVALSARVKTSIRQPAAFVQIFDTASLYEAVEDGECPGPDRDPRGDR